MATRYIKLKRTQRPKPKKAAFYVTARVFRGNDSFLARVPGAMTTIPEVPEVILIDDWAYNDYHPGSSRGHSHRRLGVQIDEHEPADLRQRFGSGRKAGEIVVSFICDVCQKVVLENHGFVVARGHNGGLVTVYRFPMGSRLQEAHKSLHHVCGKMHLKQLLGGLFGWEKK